MAMEIWPFLIMEGTTTSPLPSTPPQDDTVPGPADTATRPVDDPAIAEVLAKWWGFDALRPLQEFRGETLADHLHRPVI